jgi:hypothetical protein
MRLHTNSDGEITYTSSDVNIVVFQGTKGIILKPGQVIVTAFQDTTSVFHSAYATATITILQV